MQNQPYFSILAMKTKTHGNKVYNRIYLNKKNPLRCKSNKTCTAYKLKTTVKEIKEHLNELEDRLC